MLVKDIYPGARSADIDWMIAASNRVYFVADDGVHGRELWTSDGTAAGTHLALDIVAGAGSPVIQGVRALGHLALFSADDGVHGRELWRSDGGAAGTFLARTSPPARRPSNPLEFTPVGGQVYFTANDNVTGNELWAVPAATLLTTFQDVPPDSWAWGYIEALVAAGITTGCAPGEFCFGGAVTRAEIAAFLERGIHGPGFVPPPPTGTRFADVPAGYWAADWIEQLAADGITTGCAPNLYCPSSLVNRSEMAVFLLRARHGGAYVPPPSPPAASPTSPPTSGPGTGSSNSPSKGSPPAAPPTSTARATPWGATRWPPSWRGRSSCGCRSDNRSA